MSSLRLLVEEEQPDYFGLLGDEFEEDLILNEASITYRQQLAALKFSALKLKCFPCKLTMLDDHENESFHSYELLVEYLKERFNYDTTKYELSNSFGDCEYILTEVIPNGLYLYIGRVDETRSELELSSDASRKLKDNKNVFDDLIAYFRPEYETQAGEIFQQLKRFRMKENEKQSVEIICLGWDYDDDDSQPEPYLYLQSVEVNDPKIEDLDLHYGNGFSKVHESLKSNLVKKEANGLVLLHGEPGTGKTNYIRHLIKELKDKKLIYISPDMVDYISKPMFLPFMMKHSGSILIIEDAENIIKSRNLKENKTQAVANLLNLSDGLLGDSLHQPIIATFNCDLSDIDQALLRKGRLIKQHEFTKLDTENAQRLSERLGFKTKITEPTSLAEIYAQNK